MPDPPKKKKKNKSLDKPQLLDTLHEDVLEWEREDEYNLMQDFTEESIDYDEESGW